MNSPMSVTSCEQLSKVERLVFLISKYATLYVEGSQKIGNREEQKALSSQIQEHADQVANLCGELARLIQKPGQSVQTTEDGILETAMAYTKSTALAIALDMDFFEHVKPGGTSTTVEELAQVTGASEKLIKNVMRICADSSIFKEVTTGAFGHTERSLLLRERDSYVRAYSGYLVDDAHMAGAFLPGVLREHGFQPPPDRKQSAFCKAFNVSDPYDYYHSTDLVRGARFDRAMQGNHAIQHHPIDLVISFDKLPFGAVVVDVGAGRGHNALRLATKFPHLTVVVQDHENVIFPEEDQLDIPPSVEGRIQFLPHDYFDEQPIEDADVYILSNILMDNPDSDCKRILSRIATAMTPNKSKLVICDKLDSEARPVHHQMSELHIFSCFNSWSRSIDEWRRLITESADGLAVDRFWEIGSGVVLEIGLMGRL
ncbi:hypothetical protein CNMCM6936_006531 [Aspergillus lentulus]|nr:hypothetical protein CNMCM6936_006531 [Aspergillus lentulus]